MKLPPLESLEWLQGSSGDLSRSLQIGLLIQPNCPGCHMHAVPLANEIFQDDARRDFDLYVVSTAFEDFEFNNVESAKALINEGKLVGVSKLRLGADAPAIPVMPVAHDIVVSRGEAPQSLVDVALQVTKDHAREQMSHRVPAVVLERALAQVGPEALPHKLAHVFYAVKAYGTPTWFASMQQNGEILDQKFGRVTKQALFDWVAHLKKKHNL